MQVDRGVVDDVYDGDDAGGGSDRVGGRRNRRKSYEDGGGAALVCPSCGCRHMITDHARRVVRCRNCGEIVVDAVARLEVVTRAPDDAHNASARDVIAHDTRVREGADDKQMGGFSQIQQRAPDGWGSC